MTATTQTGIAANDRGGPAVDDATLAWFNMGSDLDELAPEEDDDEGGVEAVENVTPSISEGDFFDPRDHAIFVNLKRRVREACNVNSKRDVRRRALEWIYIPNSRDKHGLEFDNSCMALGARPDVVRTRTSHQFWKAGVLFAEGLPASLCMRPPDSLIAEIAAKIGQNTPTAIARAVWYWPSIPVEVLRSRFAKLEQVKYEGFLNALEAEGYIAIATGRAYFIGRNPELMSKTRREKFSFSQSIHTFA